MHKIVGPLVYGSFYIITHILWVSVMTTGVGALIPNVVHGIELKYEEHTLIDHFEENYPIVEEVAEKMKNGCEEWLLT